MFGLVREMGASILQLAIQLNEILPRRGLNAGRLGQLGQKVLIALPGVAPHD
jgi:hypothetical protein